MSHPPAPQFRHTGPDADATLIWLQRDALGPLNPAIVRHPGATRFFVFDTAWMDEEMPSMKRLRFIEDCLAEIGARSVRGDFVTSLLSRCQTEGISRVVTTMTPCRHARLAIAELARSIRVDILDLAPLIGDPGPFDLRSFSKYWARASKSAFGKA